MLSVLPECQYSLFWVLHRANLRLRTASSLTHIRFCKTFLVSGGFSTLEPELEQKEERTMDILYWIRNLNVFTNASMEEWWERWCRILLNAFHNDRWSPECSAIISQQWADFAFDICLLQRCICLVNHDLIRGIGFLHQTCAKYPHEAKMSWVIHGLATLGEISLVTGGAWTSDCWGHSYCCASSAVFAFRIFNRFLILYISL